MNRAFWIIHVRPVRLFNGREQSLIVDKSVYHSLTPKEA